jgi:hypothetical protein
MVKIQNAFARKEDPGDVVFTGRYLPKAAWKEGRERLKKRLSWTELMISPERLACGE